MASFLEIGLINADISVMRLLPPELAFRYHALPVATDGDHITVAMAQPEDQRASRAIQEVIDHPICFIHADPGLIDNQLHHLWPASAPHPRMLVWLPDQAGPLKSFLQYLAEILDAEVDEIGLPVRDPGSMTDVIGMICDRKPDILIFQDSHPTRIVRRLLKEIRKDKTANLSSFMALPAQPAWPIRKLLLILPDSKLNSDLAVSWTEKLAGPGEIQVTILPVLPPVPLFYGSFLRHNLETALIGNDQLGMKMRQIARRFTIENIQGVYKMREGDPAAQIRDEILSSQPDLIVLPSCIHPGCKSWLYADLTGMLFKTLPTPLLLTSEG